MDPMGFVKRNHPHQTRCQTFSLQMKWNRWIETEKTSVGYVFFLILPGRKGDMFFTGCKKETK